MCQSVFGLLSTDSYLAQTSSCQ
uniref:Uncharacterized protein n=1 Tax=Rhizophora mucronata TaxID=61149 RepID=A0A2P2JEC7_RHIMU